LVPAQGPGGIDTDGLDLSADAMARLLEVDAEAWQAQIPQMREHLARFGDRLPSALKAQLDALAQRLGC
jgi:phosphoenolpyruvate carboxykinase (GTP)